MSFSSPARGCGLRRVPCDSWGKTFASCLGPTLFGVKARLKKRWPPPYGLRPEYDDVTVAERLRAPPTSVGFLGKESCFLARTNAFLSQGESEKALASTIRAPPRVR